MTADGATGVGARVGARLAGLVAVAAATVPLAFLSREGRWAWPMRTWARGVARCVGLRVSARGSLPPPGALVAANHVGYLDVLALGAVAPGRFVAKAEIAGWGGLGFLARRGGTVFAERERPRESLPVIAAVARRLVAGDRVILFPEAGVAGDGTTLGPFRPMVFEAAVRADAPVVPAALRYLRPAEPRVWAWIDEPNLWRHLRTRVLPAPGIEVEVRFGPPLDRDPGDDRKTLAARARDAVRDLLDDERNLTDREDR